MATEKKHKKQEKGTLAIPYAMVRATKENVLLQASGVIQHDAIFYNAAIHKGGKAEPGHGILTCPKCEDPDVHANEASESTGSKKTRRDHFSRFPKQYHAEDCEWKYLEEEHGPPREINYNKGGYFYLNTGKLPGRPPYRDIFKKVSSRIPKTLSLLPDWIKSIQYEDNRHGYDSIANDDFKDRPRLNGISSAESYLKLMQSIPTDKMKDTWVINRGVAVRLDHAILRVGTTNFKDRTPEQIRDHKKSAGLKSSFLMAANPNYDKFAKLLDEERDYIKHPVLLHFKVSEKPKRETKDGETFWTTRLTPFDIENVERKKPFPHPLALPTSKVYRHVHIYDETIIKDLQIGREFFAIAHPNLSSAHEETPNRTYYQHFNILRACDIIQMTQQELAESLNKSAAKRASRAAKAAEPAIQLNLLRA